MSYAIYKNIGAELNNVDPELLSLVTKIISENHRKDIIGNNRITIIDNYADWCTPCKETTQPYAILAKKYIKRCAVVKENVDDNIYGAMEINAVPCFHFYIDGKYIPELTITGGDISLVDEYIQKSIESIDKNN
jgi:thiol-disulfide isomerase/thioredoxin